ncbi:MAG: hypothetical protein EOS62_30590 [Mesorhizobium sp.]|nr:MAG: hypothetical protein EOS62_30590 [Mesorhizobium sp.]
MKLIFWDGTGVCLYAKRLEDGEVRWPKVHLGVMRLMAAQLLIGGVPIGVRHRRVSVDLSPLNLLVFVAILLGF